MKQSSDFRGTHDVVRHALAFDAGAYAAAAAPTLLPGFSASDMWLLRDLLCAEHNATSSSFSVASPASSSMTSQTASGSSMLLFVYGSLRHGQVNHHVLAKRQCVPYAANTAASSGQGSASSLAPVAVFHTVHAYTMLGLASGAYPFVIDREHASSFAALSSFLSSCMDGDDEAIAADSRLESQNQDAWLPPATPIVGEIYCLPIAELAALDHFEGDDYTRRVVACRRAPAASVSTSAATSAHSSSAQTDDGGEIVYASMYMAADAEVRRALLSRVRAQHNTGVVLVPGGDWAAHLRSNAPA
jgi:gamma-glutamylcyclotransferase (GGCT)/AIG2-like uncharacterized protein YtfP